MNAADARATIPLPASPPSDERATVPLPGSDASTVLSDSPTAVGRFVVRGWLGAGAFGEVYQAYDPQLDREVALKVARPGSLNTPERVARFLREAKAAANLRHPHIVPLYESGTDGDRRFIVSAFIVGRTLEAVIHEASGVGSSLSLQQLAEVGRKLADALAYAHSQGVVHRDVKPANVLVDAAGEPHLLDFGLAARQEEEGAERLTQDGQGMGTPAYMAPEQADGKGQAASDQYSLGCTLYEMATGQTPFAGGPVQQMFLHQSQQPPPPRSIRPDVPKDLDTLLLKCLEKEPARRYASCGELADDLRRFAFGEPVKVRRAGPVERFTRWAKRNKKLAGMGALVVLTMALGTAFSLGFGLYANEQAGEALTQKKKAEEKTEEVKQEKIRAEGERDRAEWSVYVGLLANAQRAWADGQAGLAHDYLDQCRWDYRGWEHRYLQTLCAQGQVVHQLPGKVGRVAVGPDGTKAVYEEYGSGSIRLWDASTDEVKVLWGGATDKDGDSVDVESVAWSPLGGLVAGVTGDNTVRVWDAASGRLVCSQTAERLEGDAVWSPDGSQLVVSCESQLWHMTATPQGSLDRIPFKFAGDRIMGGCWSPDQRYYCIIREYSVHLWDVLRGREAARWASGGGRLICVTWTPDGRHILAGGSDNAAYVWVASTGELLHTLRGHTEPIRSVSCSPDGRVLATGGRESTIRLWDVSTGRLLRTLIGQLGSVEQLAWMPDGRILISLGWDTLTHWALDASDGVIHTGNRFPRFALSPDSRRGALETPEGALSIWDLTTGRSLYELVKVPEGITAVAWSANGKWIAGGSNSDPCLVRVWDAENGTLRAECRGDMEIPFGLAWHRDERRLVSRGSGHSGQGHLWNTRTGGALATLPPQPSFTDDEAEIEACVSFSPNGSRLLAGRLVFDLVGDRLTQRFDLGNVGRSVWHPDGTRLLSESADGTLQERSADDGHLLRTFADDAEGNSYVTWSPDGDRVVTAGRQNTLRIWNAHTGRVVLTLSGHTEVIRGLAWSGDGTRILSGSADRSIRNWAARPYQGELPLPGAYTDDVRAEFAPTDTHLRTTTTHGETKFWSLQTGREIAASGLEQSVRDGAWGPSETWEWHHRDGQLFLSRRSDSAAHARDRNETLTEWSRPRPDSHLRAAIECEANNDRFAAAYHHRQLAEFHQHSFPILAATHLARAAEFESKHQALSPIRFREILPRPRRAD